jgi:multidrug efflux system membrane fusion protein
VRQGEPLFTIDSRPYEAALRLAEANLARDDAQFDNAKKEAARQEELLKKGIASQGEYDQAHAAADALAAAIQADKAAIERAKLDIGYCNISAPFDGRAGAMLVDQGNLVKVNDMALVTIDQIHPIQVSFSVPQGELPEIQKQMTSHKIAVKAVIPGQEAQPETGELTFIDNAVNATTGTIVLKGTFDNSQERLWPGRYVDVVLVLTEETDAIVIPARAIQTGQKGQYVYVIKPDMTVEDRVIEVERTLGREAVISKGLAADEQVVTDGQLRLTPGGKVAVKPEVDGAKPPAPAATSASGQEAKP